MLLKTSLAGLVLSVSVGAQGLVLLEGAAPTSLDVRIVDEGQLAVGGGSILLDDIEVLPIEITGRRASQELDRSSPLVAMRNGIPRIELPGRGCLLAYRRLAGAFWGFLLVPRMGGAQVVVELPGLGGTSNPFADRIALSRDGVHAVIPESGGVTCHVLRLDGGTLGNGAISRTVTIPGGADNTGVMVGATAVFATANDRIFRFPLAAGPAVELTPSLVAPRLRLKPELAMSGDGTQVVFLFGDTNQTMRLYMLSANAPAATVLPPLASKYEEPGYLPEGTGDLRLMLNEDGSRLFYVENGLPGNGHGGEESFVLDTTGVLPTLQVTADEHFEPYVGIHILPSFKGTTLVAAIGDADLMDWFKADLTAAGGTVVNMTRTGSLVAPFGAGALIPSKAKIVGSTVLATDVTTATRTLRRMDLATGTSQVLFQDLPTDLTVGEAVDVAADILVPGTGDRLYSGQTGALIGAAPPGVRLTPPLSMPLVGVTSVAFLPGWDLVTFYLPTGEVVFGPLVQDLDQMVLTPGGGLLLSGSTLLYLSIGNPTVTVPLAPQPVRVFLTGANG